MLELGQTFATIQEAREAINRHVLDDGESYKVYKSDSTRHILQCKSKDENCSFSIRAALSKKKGVTITQISCNVAKGGNKRQRKDPRAHRIRGLDLRGSGRSLNSNCALAGSSRILLAMVYLNREICRRHVVVQLSKAIAYSNRDQPSAVLTYIFFPLPTLSFQWPWKITSHHQPIGIRYVSFTPQSAMYLHFLQATLSKPLNPIYISALILALISKIHF
jgi:hypothetical protein